jgi:hypothetical protein
LLVLTEIRSLFTPIRTYSAVAYFDLVERNLPYKMPISLEAMGQYSVLTRLNAPGGLIAQYYRAPGFESMIANYNDRNHQNEVLTEYTQVRREKRYCTGMS